ncbi:periplasmic solute binding protein [Reticulomyxa filosa]|uniref:Periplasmic solute binding protein n=1 Tax=Reticulomyxa filosa TaxID=46433 RepID=X6NR61_RETFI|nr:periplasmic solute binding protein [Reticulomyxa filosa]|eukprot:ETO28219.1 periplasmic solute binding protein [Reticulomyxa filosa]
MSGPLPTLDSTKLLEIPSTDLSDNNNHNHTYVHGHAHDHGHSHGHAHDHGHSHGHSHGHGHGHPQISALYENREKSQTRKDADTISIYKQSHNSFYHLLKTKRRQYLQPNWATLTLNEFVSRSKIHRQAKGTTTYLKTWFNYCEVIDPLWKKVRAIGKQNNKPLFIRDHMTLWAYDTNKNKVIIVDEKSLKQISKVLAAYVMRHVLSRTALMEDSVWEKTATKSFVRHMNEREGSYIFFLPPPMSLMHIGQYHFGTIWSNRKENSPFFLFCIESNGQPSVRGYLIENDFVKMFGNGKRYEAHRAFRRFDSGQKGKVTFVNLHRRLFHFLNDTINARQTYDSYQDILGNLEAIVSLLVFFVCCFVFLLIFHYDITTAISMYASLIALVLIFGSSALTSVVNGVILTYLIQPFSVGDVIYLNNIRYTVKKMGLTSTFFETSWGTPAVWSNTQILNYLQGMLNFSKSRNETHNIEFQKLFLVYIKHIIPLISNDNVWIIFYELDSLGRTRVCLWIDSLLSFANSRARWEQHSEIIFGVRKILEDLKIKMYWPPNTPTHSISIACLNFSSSFFFSPSFLCHVNIKDNKIKLNRKSVTFTASNKKYVICIGVLFEDDESIIADKKNYNIHGQGRNKYPFKNIHFFIIKKPYFNKNAFLTLFFAFFYKM